MYTYYTETKLNAHYASASEFARILQHCGYSTETDRPLVLFLSRFFQKECEKRKDIALFYPARKGLMRVYPKGARDLNQVLLLLDAMFNVKRVYSEDEEREKEVVKTVVLKEVSSRNYKIKYVSSNDVRRITFTSEENEWRNLI